jgi:transposase
VCIEGTHDRVFAGMANNKVIFKPYSPAQHMLLPPSLEELIALSHPVRVVNEIIESINLELLEKDYKGGGTSSYHPKMLLKIVVYGYVSNVYSSRKLEAATKENIHFMWLAGMQTPDHNTINNFRGKRLQQTLKDIFTQIVELLVQEGVLSIKDINVDGTKIEATSNRYTFVWGNAIKTNKEKIKKQIEELWQYTQKVADEEDKDPTPPDFTTISRDKVEQTIEKIDKALRNKRQVSKKVKQKLNYARNKWPEAIEKYEAQEKILNGRNSYSKTDHDATFMRMKDDHMKNGQLKAAYNVQISTADQYIVDYSVHPNPTDTATFKKHIEQHRQNYNEYPGSITADAGYGSEENLQYLEDKAIEGYVKYASFDKEQSSKHYKKKPFAAEHLHYNEQKDCYYCPMGQAMHCIGSYKKITSTGFEQTIKRYQAQNCNNCPLRGVCHQSKHNRVIEINHNLNRHKAKAKEKLNTQEGIKKRKKRCYDAEPVFGNIKSNHKFNRFMLRGKKKVMIEVGLFALAQNIRKKAA